MSFVNFSTKEILVKIVYYGPGLGGKTTSLQYIYNSLPESHRGKMISLATDEDRTIYFDFLPVYLGKLSGFTVRLQLYTVPGQVRYNQTRRLVLKGVDGIVFVADLQRHRKFSNIESFQNLEENLGFYGLQLQDIPHVIQYNKIDLSNILSVEELNPILNKYNVPYFPTCAITGEGVLDALTTVSRMVFDKLRRQGLKGTTEAAAAAAEPAGLGTPEDAQVEIVEIDTQTEPLTTEDLEEAVVEDLDATQVEVAGEDIHVIEPPPTETAGTEARAESVESPSAEALGMESEFHELEVAEEHLLSAPDTESETSPPAPEEPILEPVPAPEEGATPPPTPEWIEGESSSDTETPATEESPLQTGSLSEWILEDEDLERVEVPEPATSAQSSLFAVAQGVIRWWRTAVPSDYEGFWYDLFSAIENQDLDAFRVSLDHFCATLTEQTGQPVELLIPEALRAAWPVAIREIWSADEWNTALHRWIWMVLWGLGWISWQKTLA